MSARHAGVKAPRGWISGAPTKIGFGGYRVEEGVAEHRQALELYLERGGDVIDTAGNYTSGGSERLIGATLTRAWREQATVVTKAGYLEPMAESKARDGLGVDFPERVDTGYGFFHCIHPTFLRAALERSLTRMKAERVDVFLLHNPGYFLTTKSDAKGAKAGLEAKERRVEFRRRLTEAFAFLEDRVRAGVLGGYGISSNHMGHPDTNPEAVTVGELLEVAKGVSEDHAFSTIQCPFNLLERLPSLPVYTDGRSSLQHAREAGLAVLTNRPLNAWRGMQIQLRDGRARDTRAELYLDALRRALDAAGYDRADEIPGWGLAHTALDLVRSHPDVTCVLNGMRRPSYVRMAHEVLAQAPAADAARIIEGLY